PREPRGGPQDGRLGRPRGNPAPRRRGPLGVHRRGRTALAGPPDRDVAAGLGLRARLGAAARRAGGGVRRLGTEVRLVGRARGPALRSSLLARRRAHSAQRGGGGAPGVAGRSGRRLGRRVEPGREGSGASPGIRGRGPRGGGAMSSPEQQSGRFGKYGGRFVPETLIPALDELARAWAEARVDPAYRAAVAADLRDWAGRPTPLTFAARLTESFGG